MYDVTGGEISFDFLIIIVNSISAQRRLYIELGGYICFISE